jgi:nonribosomal peptide synthetase DhbF
VHFTPKYGAHIIYTSGSTGKPKGVLATHANVMRLVRTNLGDPALAEEGVWSLLHSYAFDFSVYEIWGAFASGSQLVLASEEVAHSPRRLLQLLIDERVSVLNITPGSYANLMLEASRSGRVSELAIRLALVGGEAWSASRIAAHPPRARIRNVYGPTECTIFTTLSRPLDLAEGTPPLGEFLPNVKGYVLDSALRPCPVGVEGELYVAGEGVATAYLNRPGLSASFFLANPHGGPGERMYRTGDRVVWSAPGRLEFRGRDDTQCKLRGFRIELGEIESALLELPLVEQAVVRILEREANQAGASDTRQLVAYVVPAEDKETPVSLAETVMPMLRQRLPTYMVPSVYISLVQMPMTVNGKLDIDALPDSSVPDGNTHAYRAPQSPLEIAVCQQIAEVLNLPAVGLDDQLAGCGMDSLGAARLAAKLEFLCEPAPGVVEILSQDTVANLIDLLNPARESELLDPLAEVVALRSAGSGVPVFCLYPGTGLGWAYAHLLPLVDRDRPVYLIQAHNLRTGPVEPAMSFPELVRVARQGIQAIRPQGPYSLVGWSFGGMLAHCVATDLLADGESVDSLTLIDSYPMPAHARPDYSRTDRLWRDVALGAGLQLDESQGELDSTVIAALARKQDNLLRRLPLATVESMAFNLRQNSDVLADARPGHYPGDLLFYRAIRQTRGQDRSSVSPDDWRHLTGGRLRVIDIDAEHQTMLSVDAVAQMLAGVT